MMQALKNMGTTALYKNGDPIFNHLLAAHDLTFDPLKESGTVYPSVSPVMLWEDLNFPTPSGKIELASTRAVADDHPLVPRNRLHVRQRHGAIAGR